MTRFVILCCAAFVLAACVQAPPSIEGGAAAPPAPNAYWVPPASVMHAADTASRSVVRPAIPPDALEHLSIADAVDLALTNNPATRISWAQARAAADLYGASRGTLYPTLSAGAAITRSKALTTSTLVAGERTQYGPSASLSYLVLDFGGRSGAIAAARQTAVAADLAHNATVQSTVLAVEVSIFNFLGTRALRDADKSAVDEAAANLAAAEERHRVGLATIADVLQARTAHSQAQLDLESLEGELNVARGGLAVAMGLPATTPFDVPDVPPADSAHAVSASVDSLIALAVRSRPELAEAQAQAEVAAAEVRATRGAALPSIVLTGTGGYTGSDIQNFQGRTYTLNLGLSIPVFAGFSHLYDVRAANEQLKAAQARTEQTRQQIALDVFTSYYGLRTATDRVGTAADLLASAEESERVAHGRYTEGVGSIVDLLIAQSALASARAQAVQSRWQWRAALAQFA
ncbi:MAG TPA: TolC family protein, partial [Gemmatimonadaceae bacterium]